MSIGHIVIDGKTKEIPGSVLESIVYKDLILVLYNWYGLENPEDSARNIWAFSKVGELVWKIEAIASDGCYSGMRIVEKSNESSFQVYNMVGYFYVVDLTNGKISPWRDPSWPSGYKPRPW